MADMVWTQRKADACNKAYKDGKTLAQLSERFGVSTITIRRWLLEQGVKMRPRGLR